MVTEFPPVLQWPADRGGKVHLVRQYIGTVVEALCTQTVPVADTSPAPTGGAGGSWCMACLVIHGTEVSGGPGDMVNWA